MPETPHSDSQDASLAGKGVQEPFFQVFLVMLSGNIGKDWVGAEQATGHSKPASGPII